MLLGQSDRALLKTLRLQPAAPARPDPALTRRLKPLRADRQRRDLLTEIIVQLAGDARALDLLRFDQVSGEFADLEVAGLEHRLALAQRRLARASSP